MRLGVYWPAVAATLFAAGSFFRWLAEREGRIASEQTARALIQVERFRRIDEGKTPPWAWVAAGVAAYFLISKGEG